MVLACEEAGQGVPLVLIHGYPLDHTMWRPQLDGLADVARVIAVDLRGFGKSPEATGVVTMDDHACDVKALLDRLGIQRAVICGLSMGGYVTLAFAELYPERVKGIILCNTRAVGDGEAAQRMRGITAQKALDGGIPDMVDGMVAKLLSPHSLHAKPELVRWAKELLLRQSPMGWAASSRGMAARPDRTSLLEQLDVPALVITGGGDRLIAPRLSKTMAAKLPKGRLVVIPGVGHLSNREDPEAFNSAVREYLAQFAQ